MTDNTVEKNVPETVQTPETKPDTAAQAAVEARVAAASQQHVAALEAEDAKQTQGGTKSKPETAGKASTKPAKAPKAKTAPKTKAKAARSAKGKDKAEAKVRASKLLSVVEFPPADELGRVPRESSKAHAIIKMGLRPEGVTLHEVQAYLKKASVGDEPTDLSYCRSWFMKSYMQGTHGLGVKSKSEGEGTKATLRFHLRLPKGVKRSTFGITPQRPAQSAKTTEQESAQ